MMELLTFKERLLYAMEKKAISASEICRMTGIQPSQMSRYTNGSIPMPSRATINKIALKIGVNATWLSDGVGPVWANEPSSRQELDSTKSLAVATTHISSIMNQLVESSALGINLPDSVKSSLLERLESEIRAVREVVDRSL